MHEVTVDLTQCYPLEPESDMRLHDAAFALFSGSREGRKAVEEASDRGRAAPRWPRVFVGFCVVITVNVNDG